MLNLMDLFRGKSHFDAIVTSQHMANHKAISP